MQLQRSNSLEKISPSKQKETDFDSQFPLSFIFPDQSQRQLFSIKRIAHTWQYESKHDLIGHIKSMHDKKCIHVIFNQNFDAHTLDRILKQTDGTTENIICYHWNALNSFVPGNPKKDFLHHVSLIYIDKAQKQVYYMPDYDIPVDKLFAFESTKDFKDLGYTVCLPIVSLFEDDIPGLQRDTGSMAILQKDTESCSFIVNQMAQKLEYMNRENNSLSMIHNQRSFIDGIPKSFQVQSRKEYQFKMKENLQNESLGFYFIPDEFCGLSQRTVPLILNNHLQEKYSGQKGSALYNRSEQKRIWRAAWEAKGVLFEFKKDVPDKFEKFMQQELNFKAEYQQKKGHILKRYNPQDIHPGNILNAIQMARKFWKMFPGQVSFNRDFFNALGIEEARKQDVILEIIKGDKPHFILNRILNGTYHFQHDFLTQTTQETDVDDEIPDMDDADLQVEIVAPAQTAAELEPTHDDAAFWPASDCDSEDEEIRLPSFTLY